MYSVVYIALSFDYNVDFYVKMYAVEDIEFKYMKSIKNKNQDGCQIPRCLSKIDQFNLSLNNYISFLDTCMKFELTGYGGNIYSNKNHGT